MSPIIDNGKIVGGISIVSNIEDVRKLSDTIHKYENEILRLENRIQAINRAKYAFDDIIAKDRVSLKLKADAMRIAQNDTTVLLMGESGTGKELYAQAIHNESRRRHNSFIAVNCAAFQKDLLESELFGYEDGAFTGAKKGGKMGLFEAADKGTIFLDEISEMSLETQGHLLRTLQEHTIRRVGGIKRNTGEHPSHSCYQQKSRKESGGGDFPAGPVLQDSNISDQDTSSQGAQRRHRRTV